jgi:hypothetical protein
LEKKSGSPREPLFYIHPQAGGTLGRSFLSPWRAGEAALRPANVEIFSGTAGNLREAQN